MVEFIVEEAPSGLAEDFEQIFEQTKGFVAGGAIRNYFESLYGLSYSTEEQLTFNKEQKTEATLKDFTYITKDVDMFFENEEDFQEFVNEHYDEDNIFGDGYSTANSTGFEFNTPTANHGFGGKIFLDCVKRRFGNPTQILKDFDYVNTQAALFKSDGKDGLIKNKIYLLIHPDFKNSIKNRKLVLSSGEYSKRNILERAHRYIEYGYEPDEDNAYKIIQETLKTYPEFKDLTIEKYVEIFKDGVNVKRVNKIKNARKNSQRKDFTPKKNSWEELLNSVLPKKKTKEKSSIADSLDGAEEFPELNNLEKMVDSKSLYKNALIELLLENHDVASRSSDSLASHVSLERHYIRSIKNRLNAPEGFENNKKKIYRDTVDKLDLPSTISLRSNIDYSIVSFHELLIKYQTAIGREKIVQIVDFVHSQSVAEIEGKKLFFCTACDNHRVDKESDNRTSLEKTLEHMDNYMIHYRSSNNWMEIIHKAIEQCGDDPEAIKTTIEWFIDFDNGESNVPSLSDFHEALDDKVFDSNIPPSIMINIMSTN